MRAAAGRFGLPPAQCPAAARCGAGPPRPNRPCRAGDAQRGLSAWRSVACVLGLVGRGGADVLGVLLGAVLELLGVLLPAVLDGLLRALGGVLGDLLAVLERFRAGFLDLRLDVVGDRSELV